MPTRSEDLFLKFEEVGGIKIARIRIDGKIFSKESLLSAIFVNQSKFAANFEFDGNGDFSVRLFLKDDSLSCLEKVLSEFHSSLVESQIRLRLEEKFGAIKNSIFLKVFGVD